MKNFFYRKDFLLVSQYEFNLVAHFPFLRMLTWCTASLLQRQSQASSRPYWHYPKRQMWWERIYLKFDSMGYFRSKNFDNYWILHSQKTTDFPNSTVSQRYIITWAFAQSAKTIRITVSSSWTTPGFQSLRTARSSCPGTFPLPRPMATLLRSVPTGAPCSSSMNTLSRCPPYP